VISAAEFGLSIKAFIWTVLDILLVCNFWEVQFTAVMMPIFFELTEPNIFGVIFGKKFWLFFAKSCLLAALSIEFDRGQRKAVLFPEPKLPIGLSFQGGM
jgi:hypothetical protein